MGHALGRSLRSSMKITVTAAADQTCHAARDSSVGLRAQSRCARAMRRHLGRSQRGPRTTFPGASLRMLEQQEAWHATRDISNYLSLSTRAGGRTN